MHRLAKTFPLAAALALAPALADQAETRGGIRITSDDGKFEATIGGRIHFDGYLFDDDIEDPVSTTEFRRARITFAGKAYGWQYKLEQDFAAGSTTAGFRDVFIATDVGGGTLTIGQFKPFRSMAELTSSNEITMMERPFSSGTGLYAGRQFQQGLGWRRHWGCYTLGLAVFNLRNASGPRNDGVGTAGRFTWAPVDSDERTLHLGLSLSHENPGRNTDNLEAEAVYAGRRGPQQLIALTPDSDRFFGNFGDEFFLLGSGGDEVNTVGLELAGSYGPFYAQAEYAFADYEGDFFVSEAVFENLFGNFPPFACDPVFGCFIGDQDVRTWYLMGSWMLTGEHKPYDSKTGVFRSAKVPAQGGAWEVTARYDSIENRDIHSMKATSTIVGLNYYVNPRVRFMLNATFGNDRFTGDRTKQLALRAQMSW